MRSTSGSRVTSGNAAFTLEGDIRVGIELVGASPAELAITAVLRGITEAEGRHAVPPPLY